MTSNDDDDLTRLPAGLPVPEDDGAASHLLGSQVPSVALPSTSGTSVDLAALDGVTVVYLYPMTGRPGTDLPDGWDEIPGAQGCTAEACAFRDHLADLLAYGAEHVFGLSTQTTEYQREAVDRLHLPYPLLSDAGMELVHAWRLPTFTAGELTLLKRLTFILWQGYAEKVFYPVFPPDEHPREVLEYLRARP